MKVSVTGGTGFVGKAVIEDLLSESYEVKKNERANALKEVKRLCKEFSFTAGMLKGSLAKGRGEK